MTLRGRSLLREVVREALRRPALEVVGVLEPELLDARLAVGAFLPVRAGALVAADVDHLAREELDHLVQDVLIHLERRFLAEAEFAAVPDAGAAKFRIGGDGGSGMSGDVYLGHDADATRGGVADDVAHLVLGVEVRAVVAVHHVHEHRRGALGGRLADGADRGELRVAVDFEPPAVVVREMPVEDVEAVLVHEVERPLYLVHREEVAADVEHVAAPGVLRGRLRRPAAPARRERHNPRDPAQRERCKQHLSHIWAPLGHIGLIFGVIIPYSAPPVWRVFL